MFPRKFVVLLVCVSFACSACGSSGSHRRGYVRVTSTKPRVENVKAGYSFSGDASFYGKVYDGRKTASGEIFNQNDYTCAHKSLPFGTKLKVVRDDNGASVVVRVNDRGPYVDGRILDLSVAAGKDIGLDKVGHAKVTATVIE